MTIDERLITAGVMNNTLKREVYPQIKVRSPPKLGKVRTVYDVSYDRLLMISSDNLSTHDVVHRRQVFAKGENLDAISSYFFNRTQHIIPNHYIETIAPNTWFTEKADKILIEMVFRKYITGSGWKEYEREDGQEKGREFCGVFLRPGYRKNEKLDNVIFTPTAKGQVKDFKISEFKGLNPEEDDPKLTLDIIRRNYQAFNLKDPNDIDILMNIGLCLYDDINSDLDPKNELLADTKWEFGYTLDGRILLIDECVTPDSSRIWNKEQYKFDEEKNEFTVVQDDKQHFRDHIEFLKLDKDKKALAEYWMPDDVMKKGIAKYCNIRKIITGTSPKITTYPKKEIILNALNDKGFLR